MQSRSNKKLFLYIHSIEVEVTFSIEVMKTSKYITNYYSNDEVKRDFSR